jgi:hypothetical protein
MCQGASPAEQAGDPPAAAEAEPGPAATQAAEGAAERRVTPPAPPAGSKEQQQQPASSSQQAGGSQRPAGSKQSAGSGGGSGKQQQQRARGSKDPDTQVVVAAKEAVGRTVAVWSPKLGDWPKATIAQYNPATGQHLVRYLERPAGAVKHQEDWVRLARVRFQWLTDPLPSAGANPTYAAGPRGEEAVHHKVKVFWPGMSKWYIGKVRWAGAACLLACWEGWGPGVCVVCQPAVSPRLACLLPACCPYSVALTVPPLPAICHHPPLPADHVL